YDRQAGELSTTDKDALTEAATTLRDDGFTAYVGGDALQETPGPGSGEAIGIIIALVVLAVTLGSLVAAGMPLLTAVIGVAIGLLGITTLTGFVELSSTTPALASMLGLAVGIDYALFIMARFKHEVMRGREHEEAAGIAAGTAGSAVVFAGLTVIIALVGLSVVNIRFLTEMGIAAAATVAIAVLIALTLLPALLSVAGRHVTDGHIPGLKERDPEGDASTPTQGRRWVGLVAR
ncbi:MAG: MMPL family transporter, partial [Propionibacteriaceae bacterium]|nr:MMPL family transporter [Propionibacteriaceae bacterium]